MKKLLQCLSLMTGLTLIIPAAITHAEVASYDVTGLTLGMSAKEAEAALLKHNKDLKITHSKITYSYSDGVRTFHTDEILGRIIANHRKILSPSSVELEGFILDFLGLPGKEVLTAIKRSQAGMANPPSVVTFKQALEKKYGPVTKVDRHMLRWDDANGTQYCYDALSMNESTPPLNELTPARDMEDKSSCRDYLTYALSVQSGPVAMDSKDPLQGFVAALVGAKLLAEKDAELQTWIQKLEDDANEKRAANAEDLAL